MRPKPKEGATGYALIWVGQRGDSQASNAPEGSVAAATRERRSRDRYFEEVGREEGGRRTAKPTPHINARLCAAVPDTTF